ncbi:MAG: hypothetical protein FWH11_10660 [Micrococcales bacterium]|nr:hypothetical protein [Micrococcales bacterium]
MNFSLDQLAIDALIIFVLLGLRWLAGVLKTATETLKDMAHAIVELASNNGGRDRTKQRRKIKPHK